jgi:outer membrane immunogenic protein
LERDIRGVNGGGASVPGNYDLSAPLAGFTTAGSYRPQGGIFGGQIGANYQTGHLVLGVEADWDKAGFDAGQMSVTPQGVGNQVNSRISDFYTVRGRVGYAVDRVLLYGTAGWAKEDGRSSLFVTFPTYSNSTQIPVSGSGWTAGVGVEWAVYDRFSLRAEYLHTETGNSSSITDPGGGPAPVVPRTANFNVGSIDAVRFGANYTFNAWH